MSRIPPTPVEVWFENRWHPGTLRTCEWQDDGETCSGVVSFPLATHTQTSRFTIAEMRRPGGEAGCPCGPTDGTT